MSVKKLKASNAEKTSWLMNNSLTPKYMVSMVKEIDVTAIEKLRDIYKAKNQRITYTAIVLKACSIILKRHPEVNRAILGIPFFKKLIQFTNIDISIAVETNLPFLPGQALAETILSADKKTITEITDELEQFKSDSVETNARMKIFFNILRYVPRPLSVFLINLPYLFPSLWVKHRGCACWVNAPSKAGADLVLTTWPWPITISFGYAKKRPVVVDDKIVIRKTMNLLMAFDRRIQHGGPASRIFSELVNILENPFDGLLDENNKI